MRITEVIIDGFKSYAVRTVISEWDASFNAITGLNGSGKSNILDAICFCLGIAKYDLLRASGGVQDLIYKRGQAGVTKASVTLVFDNNDYDDRGRKRLCPVGFEEYATISVTRQVVLGGTSKYLINGHRAQQQTVQNLFQSVQLNINNPNFLIMQGRVTKVLNMKPTEILGMVEEAAGTRMFEDRREKALRTMAKKQAKVEELEQLLKEEIEPKLDKLRGEKRSFLEFQSVQNDLERLTKLVIAFDYVRSSQKIQQAATETAQKRDRLAELRANSERLKHELTILEEDIARVRGMRETEVRKGGNFMRLEEVVKSRSHDMVRLTTVLELKRSSAEEEEQRSRKAHTLIKDLRNQLDSKTLKLHALETEFETENKALDELRALMETKEELLNTLQTGISSNADHDGGYSGHLTAAREAITRATTEVEQSKLKISHLENSIRDSKPHKDKAERENVELNNALIELSAEIMRLEQEMTQLNLDTSAAQRREDERARISKNIRDLQTESEALRRRVVGLDFSYTDPSPGFNREAVKGLVAQLFSLPASSTEASTAVEICAGGRLYNVVVDTANVGTQLLQHGKLRRRVTIVPLDKISSQRASINQITAAQKLAPGKVHLAVSLIDYDLEVEKAMDYVFGNTLIAADANTARKVTFDPTIRLKSVTIEGDVYDPSGTLSGGSSAQGNGVLLILQALNKITYELEQEECKFASLEQAMKNDAAKVLLFGRTKQQLEVKSHEMSLAREQIASNSSSSIIAQVNEMHETIDSLKATMDQAAERKRRATEEVTRIERDMKDLSINKAGKLEQLMQDLRKLKTSVTTAQAQIKPVQQSLRNALLDVEQTKSDLTTAEEEFRESQSMLATQYSEMKRLESENVSAKFLHDTAIAELEDERVRLGGFDEELAELEGAVRVKSQQIADEKLESQGLNHANDALFKSQAVIKQAVTNMENEYEWISDENKLFGKPGTPYSFDGQDMKARRVELTTVQERAQGMKKKINPAVMATIDSVEKKERDLKNMMRTVIRDKRKIEETISSLDEYKKEALHKTWTKVNRDFGIIFNDLLPGNTAKLDPPEGQDISVGLEVKVCLGKVWKHSLTELSGGQRSLIALSLILSLLQYSPAPMYILDEVDAALDLSHTQNIGRLIRTRFKGSQFIVVSLKDGMFTNANKIFRTRFMDGTSVVQTLSPNDVR